MGDKGAGEGRPAGRARAAAGTTLSAQDPRSAGPSAHTGSSSPPTPPGLCRETSGASHTLTAPPRGARGARGSQPRPTPQGSLQARRVPGSATAFDSVVPPLPAPSHQPPGPWTPRGLGVHQTPCPGLSLRLTLGSSQQPLPQLLAAGPAWSVGRAWAGGSPTGMSLRVTGAGIGAHGERGEVWCRALGWAPKKMAGSHGRDGCGFSSKRETNSGRSAQPERLWSVWG